MSFIFYSVILYLCLTFCCSSGFETLQYALFVCISESFTSQYEVLDDRLIGSGNNSRVYEAIRRFDGQEVTFAVFTELLALYRGSRVHWSTESNLFILCRWWSNVFGILKRSVDVLTW